jgi:hypothetical protein
LRGVSGNKKKGLGEGGRGVINGRMVKRIKE